MTLDRIDEVSAKAFEGFIVRKDLVRKLGRQYPVPTYVVEFLLGRYCSSVDPEEIEEGLKLVQEQLGNRTVRAGEEELFKARAREKGAVKIIDVIRARLDAKNDCYLAELPSLQLKDVRIADELVQKNDRMLTGGFYAEVTLGYDAVIAQEQGGRPFGVNGLREIQLSTVDVLPALRRGRALFTAPEWKAFLLRSIGFEPDTLSERAKNMLLLRMVPFVERNYNQVELGPRGTGKSHLFQQVSPYVRLVSGGKTTVAQMFVNLASGQRGLVCQYDAVCFDEISGVSFDQKDGIQIMKGFMESGEFARGKESIRADGGIVMVGNFDVDVAHQQRIGHLLGPLPAEMRDDTAFMDRIHSYVAGWDVPKLKPNEHFTDHFGLVSDFLTECWHRLRMENRIRALQDRVRWGGALSGRDLTAVQKTMSGLIKLTSPDPDVPVPDEELEWAVRIALECRRRVKEQQKRIGSAEFRATQFSYVIGEGGVEKFVSTPELQSEDAVGPDPLPPGQIWTISPGSQDDGIGLYRIEVTEGPGSGVRILNQPTPPPFRESLRYAEQNLYANAKRLVGDREPRTHEFSVQLRAFDAVKSGASIGVGALLALCGALLQKSLRGGLAAVGSLNLGGSIDPVHNAVDVAELAIEKGAKVLLMPVSARRQLIDLPDDKATKVDIQYYGDSGEALLKALTD